MMIVAAVAVVSLSLLLDRLRAVRVEKVPALEGVLVVAEGTPSTARRPLAADVNENAAPSSHCLSKFSTR